MDETPELTSEQVDNLIEYLKGEQEDYRETGLNLEASNDPTREFYRGKASGLAVAICALDALMKGCELYTRADRIKRNARAK